MAQDFSVVERTSSDGTAVYYVVDQDRGGKPTAEFGDRQAAEAKADELNARDEATPEPPEADAGQPIQTNP